MVPTAMTYMESMKNSKFHNNLSITASTYNRRGDFVFRRLDFSEFLSIFIKPSRKANILKEVLL